MLKTLYIKFKAEIGASENKATHVNLTPICLKTVNFLSSLHSILRLATSTVIRLLSPFIRFRCISPQSPRETDSHQRAWPSGDMLTRWQLDDGETQSFPVTTRCDSFKSRCWYLTKLCEWSVPFTWSQRVQKSHAVVMFTQWWAIFENKSVPFWTCSSMQIICCISTIWMLCY